MKYSEKFKAKFKKETGKTLFSYLDSFLQNIGSIFYRLDWRNGQAVDLQKWLKDQVENPNVHLLNAAMEFRSLDPDKAIVYIARMVAQRTVYQSDLKRFGTTELWQEASETWTNKFGDCEDGAILILILAALSGIPQYRIRLCCGYVISPQNPSQKVGHAYITYRAGDGEEYIMDWCFFADLRGLYRRTMPARLDYRYYKPWWSVNWVRSYGTFKLPK